MNSKQTFFGLLGALALLVIVSAGLLYFGLGELQKKGDELTQLKLKQAVMDNRKQNLVSAKRDIKEYKPLEQISKSIVPQEKDQARTVREIYAISDEAGVSLESIQFPSSALGEAKTKSKSKKTSKKPTALVDPNTTQLVEVEGAKNLYAMEIKVQSNRSQPVPYSRLVRFLTLLENNRRTAHVTNISIQPSDDNRNFVTFSLTLNLYVKP